MKNSRGQHSNLNPQRADCAVQLPADGITLHGLLARNYRTRTSVLSGKASARYAVDLGSNPSPGCFLIPFGYRIKCVQIYLNVSGGYKISISI